MSVRGQNPGGDRLHSDRDHLLSTAVYPSTNDDSRNGVSFLDLPLEVRHMIYDYHTAHLHSYADKLHTRCSSQPHNRFGVFRYQRYHSRSKGLPIFEGKWATSPLLLSCKSVCAEMTSFLAAHRVMELYTEHGMVSKVSLHPDLSQHLTGLRHLVLFTQSPHQLCTVLDIMATTFDGGKHLVSMEVEVYNALKPMTLALKTQEKIEGLWRRIQCPMEVVIKVFKDELQGPALSQVLREAETKRFLAVMAKMSEGEKAAVKKKVAAYGDFKEMSEEMKRFESQCATIPRPSS
ncbi:Hypothetical protein D9617_27g045160 [Elsinoe fawcettii]|nr:Hypothetical protein D9617_27g045160 [Elsinoe fawcettii]